jgi:crotonobetainyl-CoA:carnitine CoA-transferase CaiB-like acyl-CoA transferase
MALIVRERTGVAQRVDTNLMNAAIVISSGDFVRYPGGPEGRFSDKGQYGPGALHRLYETADDWIYLAAEGREHWGALCTALGRDDLAADPRFAAHDSRSENGAALATELGETFGKRTLAHWVKVLEEAGVPCAPVIDGYHEGFFSDPQAIANDMFVELEHPVVASYTLSRSLIRFAGTSDVDVLPTPLLGQHNREILEQVGYSPAEIEDLYSKGVAKTESPG